MNELSYKKSSISEFVRVDGTDCKVILEVHETDSSSKLSDSTIGKGFSDLNVSSDQGLQSNPLIAAG